MEVPPLPHLRGQPLFFVGRRIPLLVTADIDCAVSVPVVAGPAGGAVSAPSYGRLEFLDFIVGEAKQNACFDLRLGSRVSDLIVEG